MNKGKQIQKENKERKYKKEIKNGDIPPMVTVGLGDPGPKLAPLISTKVPPFVLPLFGVIEFTSGAAKKKKKLGREITQKAISSTII